MKKKKLISTQQLSNSLSPQGNNLLVGEVKDKELVSEWVRVSQNSTGKMK